MVAPHHVPLEHRTILARTRRPATRAVPVALLLILVALSPNVNAAESAAHPANSAIPVATPLAPVAGPRSAWNNSSGLQCDGVYWATWVWANYSPAWCYGHDEATVSFVSDAPGSGEDANYSLALPADGTYPQADFYATIWLGGVVYDAASLNGQAFLEFQFYPAPPEYTGAGSGSEDCLPNGAFYPNFDPGSNEWFVCAVVWQVVGDTEDAAFSGPLDIQGTTSIFVLHSNDQIYVNESGVAQSTTQPWQLAVTDGTTHATGTVTLQNGSLVLPPYYSTAAQGNDLIWGADTPGAVSLAYEIGHSLNPAIPETGEYGACYPGDKVCDSYWPGLWLDSGQMQLSLPVMGSVGSQTYPSEIGFGSSTQGENWINGTNTIPGDESTCSAPSWSTSTNCLYPWYTYRSQNYSFTFGANNQTNDTHDYGNWYQFPGAPASVRFHPAPWGVLNSTVTPSFARVEFNRIGATSAVPVLPNGTVYHQFLEGPYWLNVSYPGCPSLSNLVYLSAGGTYNAPIRLACPGLYNVTFNETGLPVGTAWAVTLNGSTFQTTGASISFYAPNGTQSYSVRSPVPGAPGVRYIPSPNNGTVDVLAAPLSESVAFASQFEFSAVADPPSAGLVDPALAWEAPGTVDQVTALAGPSWVFVSWTGIGNGSYSGTANPTPATLNGPIQEAAFFYFLWTVSFVQTGLSPSAHWSVDLNGAYRTVSGPTVEFQIPNGSYSYNISGPSGFIVSPGTGAGTMRGSDMTVPVQFTAVVLFGLTATALEEVLLVVVAFAIAIGVNVGFWLTHRKRPPATQSAPAKPPPPPPWLGGPPSG
ncbi:MAG: hypothetical protein WA688_01450 [Thermoplasmata archaeon]